MRYLLAAIAGMWMADGLTLLVWPRPVITRLREVLAITPSLVRWEILAAGLGFLLLWGAQGLRYEPLWSITGLAMVAKGIFLAAGPDHLRRGVLDWCLHREDVDYRFWGLGLCTLALLLLHAAGWLAYE